MATHLHRWVAGLMECKSTIITPSRLSRMEGSAGHMRRDASGNGNLVERRRETGMTPLVEMRLKGLPRRLDERRGVLEKRDADVVRTRRHRHTNLEVLVEERVVAIGGLLDRQRPDRGPIEQYLDLVRLRFLQAVDVAGVAAREPDLDVVLAVLRERVTSRKAAARPDRQSGDVLFLRDVGGNAKDVALQRRGLR